MCKSKLLPSYYAILLIEAQTFAKKKHFMTSGHISLRRDVFKCAQCLVGQWESLATMNH